MRVLLLVLSAAGAHALLAQETPLTTLPYTPSLDTEFMDRSIDPCTDFYKYACGKWNKLNPIPADQPGWNVYAKLTNENQRFLWGILEQASHSSPSRTPNEQKIGDFFHACMDLASVEQASGRPPAPMLAQIASLKSSGDITGYIAGQHRNGIDAGVLCGFTSDQDFDDSSQVLAF